MFVCIYLISQLFSVIRAVSAISFLYFYRGNIGACGRGLVFFKPGYFSLISFLFLLLKYMVELIFLALVVFGHILLMLWDFLFFVSNIDDVNSGAGNKTDEHLTDVESDSFSGGRFISYADESIVDDVDHLLPIIWQHTPPAEQLSRQLYVPTLREVAHPEEEFRYFAHKEVLSFLYKKAKGKVFQDVSNIYLFKVERDSDYYKDLERRRNDSIAYMLKDVLDIEFLYGPGSFNYYLKVTMPEQENVSMYKLGEDVPVPSKYVIFNKYRKKEQSKLFFNTHHENTFFRNTIQVTLSRFLRYSVLKYYTKYLNYFQNGYRFDISFSGLLSRNLKSIMNLLVKCLKTLLNGLSKHLIFGRLLNICARVRFFFFKLLQYIRNVGG